MKQAHRLSLQRPFTGSRNQGQVIREAYCQYGYRLAEIAEHLGVHDATISRRLKRAEGPDV